MLFSNYKNRLDHQKCVIISLTMLVAILSLSLVVNAFFTYMAYKSKRTVIIPSTIHAALEVSDIDASPEYLRTVIFYSLSLLYSYTPSSASSRYQEFLVSFVESSKVNELRMELAERLRQIQQIKVSQSFEPEEIVYVRNGVALVSGRLLPSVLGQTMPPDVLFLRVEYRMIDGNLRISAIMQLNQSEYDRLKRQESFDAKKREEEDARRRKNLEVQTRNNELRLEREAEAKAREGGDPGQGIEFRPDAIKQRNFGDGLEG